MTDYDRTRKPGENYFLTEYLTRRVAYPVALAAMRLGLSANAVTLLGGLAWVASIPLTIVSGILIAHDSHPWGWALFWTAAGLWHTGVVLDVADGSIARLRGQSSRAGAYLDYAFHLVFNPMFLCAIGVFSRFVTGHSYYSVLAVLSVCANWGLSFAAKEHVLCVAIAEEGGEVLRLADADRYRIFIDSPGTREVVDAKRRRPARVLKALAAEALCFPGQYLLFTLLAAVDYARAHVARATPTAVPWGFTIVCVLLLIRVPFRVRREYRTLCDFDRLTRRPAGPCAAPPPPSAGP